MADWLARISHTSVRNAGKGWRRLRTNGKRRHKSLHPMIRIGIVPN